MLTVRRGAALYRINRQADRIRIRIGYPRGQMSQIVSGVLVLVLVVLSGIMDAQGFVHAARSWPDGQLDWKQAGISLLAFFAGISLYIASVRFMHALGLHAVALQTAIWFVVTAVGIAALDGTLTQWTRLQQAVAVAVVAGLAWLIATTQTEVR
jgi:hypothetical protein